MQNNFETLNSPFLEPWGNQLVPCDSRDECMLVNGTQVPELIFNSFCSRIAGVDSLPDSAGYCVCPPYQMRGGAWCDSPTGLGLPIWATKMAVSLPLDLLACFILRKLYKFRLKRPQRGICLNINVQFWLLTVAVVLNILENFGQMVIMVLTISPQVRRIARYITTLVTIPLPFLLTIVATTFLATRFHRITSSLTSSTNTPSSRFRVTTFLIVIMFLGTMGLTLLSIVIAEYIYYNIASVWLTTFSSVYFVASVGDTISRLQMSSDMNQRSSTWAKVLSNSVKHFVCINLIGSIVLCVVCYLVSLPQDITDLRISNIYFWPMVPYSLFTRALVYSVASFVHKLEVMATTLESSTDNSTENGSKPVDDQPAAAAVEKEPLRARSAGGILENKIPEGSLAFMPTPSAEVREQVVTVV